MNAKTAMGTAAAGAADRSVAMGAKLTPALSAVTPAAFGVAATGAPE